MHVMKCLCTDYVSFLEWPHPVSTSRNFQRGETQENWILESPRCSDRRLARCSSCSVLLSIWSMFIFRRSYFSPFPSDIQRYHYTIQLKCTVQGQSTQDVDSVGPELLQCHRQELFSLLMVSKDFQIPMEACCQRYSSATPIAEH